MQESTERLELQGQTTVLTPRLDYKLFFFSHEKYVSSIKYIKPKTLKPVLCRLTDTRVQRRSLVDMCNHM